jgi:hypothetical protein
MHAGDDCDDEDFHAMRKDADGTWSWKLPNVPASNKDLEGRPITDPDTAPLPGHYTVCGYYRVEPAKVGTDCCGLRHTAYSNGHTATFATHQETHQMNCLDSVTKAWQASW